MKRHRAQTSFRFPWRALAVVIASTLSSIAAGQDASPAATAATPDELAQQVRPAVTVPASAPAVGAGEREARIRYLTLERERWLGRRIAIIGPLLMTGAGIGLSAFGFRYMYAGAVCGALDTRCGWTPRRIGGVVLGSTGVALAAAGAAFLSLRIVRRMQRRRALERIDEELRLTKLQVSLTPLVGLQRGAPVGLSASAVF